MLREKQSLTESKQNDLALLGRPEIRSSKNWQRATDPQPDTSGERLLGPWTAGLRLHLKQGLRFILFQTCNEPISKPEKD